MQQAANNFHKRLIEQLDWGYNRCSPSFNPGQLLFNMFLNEILMFLWKCNLCNYGDDSTLYYTGKDLNRIKKNLEMDFMILHQWLNENHVILNPGKCHYMVISSRDLSHEIMLFNNKITSSNEEKLLGIFLHNKLKYERHIGSLRRKAAQKMNALSRWKNYLTSDLRKLLLNSVIKSHFTYCSLIGMFTSRYPNNALNNIQERALWLIYNVHEKSFDSTSAENLKTIHKKPWISWNWNIQISGWLVSANREWHFLLKTKHL